tara:strand:- start:1142 stop:1456 length:315 start_codon:yes stop_codon:yes gene_type:complete
MRKDIHNDIEKITFIIRSMERKSVFICFNLENYNILSFQDFANLENKDQTDNNWVWFRIVKKENKKLYISQEIMENQLEKSINDVENLKNYVKFLLKCLKSTTI